MPKQKLEHASRPPAIGYICVDDVDDGEIAALLKDIADCCKREGLHLVRTITDRGYDGRQLARTGVIELREALVDNDGLAVVVPTLTHLSPSESIRSPFQIMIHRLGGRLVVAREANGAPDETGVTAHSIELDETGPSS